MYSRSTSSYQRFETLLLMGSVTGNGSRSSWTTAIEVTGLAVCSPQQHTATIGKGKGWGTWGFCCGERFATSQATFVSSLLIQCIKKQNKTKQQLNNQHFTFPRSIVEKPDSRGSVNLTVTCKNVLLKVENSR